MSETANIESITVKNPCSEKVHADSTCPCEEYAIVIKCVYSDPADNAVASAQSELIFCSIYRDENKVYHLYSPDGPLFCQRINSNNGNQSIIFHLCKKNSDTVSARELHLEYESLSGCDRENIVSNACNCPKHSIIAVFEKNGETVTSHLAVALSVKTGNGSYEIIHDNPEDAPSGRVEDGRWYENTDGTEFKLSVYETFPCLEKAEERLAELEAGEIGGCEWDKSQILAFLCGEECSCNTGDANAFEPVEYKVALRVQVDLTRHYRKSYQNAADPLPYFVNDHEYIMKFDAEGEGTIRPCEPEQPDSREILFSSIRFINPEYKYFLAEGYAASESECSNGCDKSDPNWISSGTTCFKALSVSPDSVPELTNVAIPLEDEMVNGKCAGWKISLSALESLLSIPYTYTENRYGSVSTPEEMDPASIADHLPVAHNCLSNPEEYIHYSCTSTHEQHWTSLIPPKPRLDGSAIYSFTHTCQRDEKCCEPPPDEPDTTEKELDWENTHCQYKVTVTITPADKTPPADNNDAGDGYDQCGRRENSGSSSYGEYQAVFDQLSPDLQA